MLTIISFVAYNKIIKYFFEKLIDKNFINYILYLILSIMLMSKFLKKSLDFNSILCIYFESKSAN